MSGWYLAPSLAVLRAEIGRRWPGRDRTSDGTIGDAAHQSRASDHNPNDRGSVNAIDIDKDGVDVAAIIAAVQRHPSAHYWIYNRQIADADGWRPRPYTGSNPHDKHLHVSIRQSREAEQDRRPWGLLEDDMTPVELLDTEIHNPVTGKPAKLRTFVQSINSEAYRARLAAEANQAELAALRAEVAALAAPELDYDRLAAALLRHIAASQG